MKKKVLFCLSVLFLASTITLYMLYSIKMNASKYIVDENEERLLISDKFNLSEFSSIQINVNFPKDFEEWEEREEVYFYKNPKLQVIGGEITSGMDGSYITYDKEKELYTLVFHVSIKTENSGFIIVDCIQEINLAKLIVYDISLDIVKH